MRVLWRTTLNIFLVASLLMIVVGSYNSAVIDKTAALRSDLAIKLAKRLDEIKGEVTIGRMAASLPGLKTSSTNLIKAQTNKLIKKEMKKEGKKKIAKDSDNSVPAPVVNDDLDLALTGGFFNKQPLDKNAEFSGSAMVQAGVIEEINVELPGGSSLSINTNERMVGNVFQYEDTLTREVKSGLFYKVKPGVFMVTLTNDSQYPGLRLEFRTNSNIELAEEKNEQESWKLNETNSQNNEEQAINNQEAEQDYYQEEAAAQNDSQEANQETTSFNFNI